MKRVALLFALCIMILALTGCGGSGGGGNSVEPTSPTEPNDTAVERENVHTLLQQFLTGITNNDITQVSPCLSYPFSLKFFWGDLTQSFNEAQTSSYFSDLFTNHPFRTSTIIAYPMTFSGPNVTIDADIYITQYTSSAKTVYSEYKYSVSIGATKYASGWKITSYICTAPAY
jgi:hypothetical protein